MDLSHSTSPTPNEEIIPLWEQIQINTFTRWVHSKLYRQCNVSFENLRADFKDGIKLILLLQILSGKSLGRYNKTVKNDLQKRENLSTSLKFLDTEKVKLVNIGSEDIFSGNKKLILGLIWTLVCHYQLKGFASSDNDINKGVTEVVSAFVKDRLKQTDIDPDTPIDFKNSWNDGVLLTAMVNSYIPAVEIVDSADNMEVKHKKVNIALDEAEKKLDVPKIIYADEILTGDADDKAIITYLASYSQIDANGLRFSYVKCNPEKVPKGEKSTLIVISKPYLTKEDTLDVIVTDNIGNVANLRIVPDDEYQFDITVVPYSDFKVEVKINDEPIKEGLFYFKVVGEAEDVPIYICREEKVVKDEDATKDEVVEEDTKEEDTEEEEIDEDVCLVQIFNEEVMLSLGIPLNENYAVLVNFTDLTPKIDENKELVLQLGSKVKCVGLQINPKCYLFCLNVTKLGPHRFIIKSEDKVLYNKEVKIRKIQMSAFWYKVLNESDSYNANETIKLMVDYRCTGLSSIEATYKFKSDVEILEDKFIEGVSIFYVVAHGQGSLELFLSKPKGISFGKIILPILDQTPLDVNKAIKTYHFGNDLTVNLEKTLTLPQSDVLFSSESYYPSIELPDVDKEYIILSAKKTASIPVKPIDNNKLVITLRTPGLFLLSCQGVVDGKEMRSWTQPILVEEEKQLPLKEEANLRIYVKDTEINDFPLNAEIILLTDPSNKVLYQSLVIKRTGKKYYCDLIFTPQISGPYMVRLLRDHEELYEGKFFVKESEGYWWIAVVAGAGAILASYIFK